MGAVILHVRRLLGAADPREYMTMVVKQPGDAQRNRRRRLEEKLIRWRV